MRMYSTIDSQGYERINTYDVNEGDIISFDIHKRKWFERHILTLSLIP